MKTCCVIDTRTGIYSNWHNRATICVVMRKRIAKTGFKPELVTPSSELARNYRYSEFSYVAVLTEVQYCQVGRSSGNSSSLMTTHCDADVQLCCAGTDAQRCDLQQIYCELFIYYSRGCYRTKSSSGAPNKALVTE